MWRAEGPQNRYSSEVDRDSSALSRVMNGAAWVRRFMLSLAKTLEGRLSEAGLG
jgi:hypothetical protein